MTFCFVAVVSHGETSCVLSKDEDGGSGRRVGFVLHGAQRRDKVGLTLMDGVLIFECTLCLRVV